MKSNQLNSNKPTDLFYGSELVSNGTAFRNDPTDNLGAATSLLDGLDAPTGGGGGAPPATSPNPPKTDDPKGDDSPTLTDEQTAIIEGVQNGHGFNDNGDVISKDGTVLKTKADIDKEAAEAANEAKPVEADILAKYPDTKYDKDGNLVDGRGTLVKTAAELDQEFGVEITLDDEGNQVDDQGKVLKTKAQLEKENFDFDAYYDSLKNEVEQIQAELGYEIKDENGNVKTYDNTIEGISEYAKDVAEQLAETRFTEKIGQHPRALEFLNHLNNGGKEETFFKQRTDWSKYEFKNLSAEDRKRVYINSLVAKGNSVQEATDMAKMYEDASKIDEVSEPALAYLKQRQKDLAKEDIKANEQRIKDEQVRVEKHWNDRFDIIDTGNLQGIKIPEADREAFKQYIGSAVGPNNESQQFLDVQKEDIGFELQMSYLRFKGFDYSKLVKTAVKKEQTLNLKSRTQQRTTHRHNRNDGNNGKPAPVLDHDLSLDNITG